MSARQSSKISVVCWTHKGLPVGIEIFWDGELILEKSGRAMVRFLEVLQEDIEVECRDVRSYGRMER